MQNPDWRAQRHRLGRRLYESQFPCCRPVANHRRKHSSSGAVPLGTQTGQPLPHTEDGDLKVAIVPAQNSISCLPPRTAVSKRRAARRLPPRRVRNIRFAHLHPRRRRTENTTQPPGSVNELCPRAGGTGKTSFCMGLSSEKNRLWPRAGEILPFQLIVETEYFPFKAWRAVPLGTRTGPAGYNLHGPRAGIISPARLRRDFNRFCLRKTVEIPS